jgi:spore maturation protein CgeB
MRFIIPSYELADNFTDNVAYTLRAMGHEVMTPPLPTRWMNPKLMHVMQLTYEKFLPKSLSPQEKWLLRSYRQFKPDAMLALTHSVEEETLLQLQKSGIRTIAWWGDAPSQMRRHGLLCKGWDTIYLKDRFAVRKLQSLDLHAHFLPEAMNPAWHRWEHWPMGRDVVIAGNSYDYRHFLIRRMLEEGCTDVRLYGYRPARWAHPEVLGVYQGKYVVREEKARVFGSAAACVNSTSMTEYDSLNCRAFEIAGSGGLQFMESRDSITDCFEPGREIVTFDSVTELVERIEYYRGRESESLAIRKAAHLRANAEHTYRHRLERIIKDMAS